MPPSRLLPSWRIERGGGAGRGSTGRIRDGRARRLASCLRQPRKPLAFPAHPSALFFLPKQQRRGWAASPASAVPMRCRGAWKKKGGGGEKGGERRRVSAADHQLALRCCAPPVAIPARSSSRRKGRGEEKVCCSSGGGAASPRQNLPPPPPPTATPTPQSHCRVQNDGGGRGTIGNRPSISACLPPSSPRLVCRVRPNSSALLPPTSKWGDPEGSIRARRCSSFGFFFNY